MIGIRNSGIALAMGLLLATPAAFAQAQTKESAHAFLASVINKGATGDRLRTYPFTNYSGSECTSRLNSSRDGHSTVYIDWSAVSEVNTDATDANVRGAIIRNGKTEQEVEFYADSATMRDRLAKAFEFLRVQCDKTKQFGF